MNAIALATYGGPDGLHPVDLPDPHSGPGQVRSRSTPPLSRRLSRSSARDCWPNECWAAHTVGARHGCRRGRAPRTGGRASPSRLFRVGWIRADAALLGDDIVGATRDGGQLVTFRPFHMDPGRGIRVHGLHVRQRATDHPALRDLVNGGIPTMQVGTCCPPPKHRKHTGFWTPAGCAIASSSNPRPDPSAERTTHEPLADPRH